MLLRVCLLLWIAVDLCAAQGGFLAGVVRDPSGSVLPDAEVRIQSESTGVRQKLRCDSQGCYTSAELVPGTYKIVVRANGFRTIVQPDLQVKASFTRIADFFIELIPLQQEYTVQGTRDESDPAGDGLAIGRQSATSTLPANGRDLHALYAIAPGSVVTPASSGDGGQFTVNGQRPNTNTVRVDGVSGNTGLGIWVLPGTYPGTSLPGMTVIGSTQDLASKDEIEQVHLRSSNFAPEYGDRPGAQIEIETRSGSNSYHGDAFGYARPAWLDSPDWYAKRYSYPLSAAFLSGYGGTFGGPLFHDKTFFFLAVEGEHVNDFAAQLMPVPSLQARDARLGPYALLLNAFPQPSGPPLNALESIGILPLNEYASVESRSARIDQALGTKGHLFARYVYAPSQSQTEQLGIGQTNFNWLSATGGITVGASDVIHDFRFNFSRVTDVSVWGANSALESNAFQAFSHIPTGGAYSIVAGSDLKSYFQSALAAGVTALSVGGIGQLVSYTSERSFQDQWEGAYKMALQHGRHSFRVGVDYIRLIPRTRYGNALSTISIVAPDVQSVVAGNPLGITASRGKPTIQHGQIPIGSLLAQDTFRLGNRLTLLYGLRWEITPPISMQPVTDVAVAGTWQGPITAFQPLGTFRPLNVSNWTMHYGQFAPRLGLAYHLRAPNLMLRVGAGAFYNDSLGSLLYTVNLSPLNTWQYQPTSSPVPLQINPGGQQPPPPLSLPRAWERRASLEKSFQENTLLSIAYVGSAGRKLLRLDGTLAPGVDLLRETHFTSQATSD